MGVLKSITQDTYVPIGVAIVVIGAVAGWVTGVGATMKTHQEVIEQLKLSNESNYKLIYEINSRLSRIEWRLEKESKK